MEHNLNLPFNLRHSILWDGMKSTSFSLEYEGVRLDQVSGDTVTKSRQLGLLKFNLRVPKTNVLERSFSQKLTPENQ